MCGTTNKLVHYIAKNFFCSIVPITVSIRMCCNAQFNSNLSVVLYVKRALPVAGTLTRTAQITAETDRFYICDINILKNKNMTVKCNLCATQGELSTSTNSYIIVGPSASVFIWVGRDFKYLHYLYHNRSDFAALSACAASTAYNYYIKLLVALRACAVIML